MATCCRCYGEGYQTYEEDGRMVTDACYHCGTTGEVDSETNYQDQLGSVATAMAIAHVQEYKRYCDEDPDGEGFAFHAAERMMGTWEYEQCLVYDYESQFMDSLEKTTELERREYIRKLIAGERIEPLYEKVD